MASEAKAAKDRAAAERREKRRKNSRWGAETEAGLKVLAEKDEQPQEEKPQTEPPAKKRRSRWEPEESKAAVIPGLQIALPASIAHLVDFNINPEALEIQRQLNNVSCSHLGAAIVVAVTCSSECQLLCALCYWIACTPLAAPAYLRHAHGIACGAMLMQRLICLCRSTRSCSLCIKASLWMTRLRISVHHHLNRFIMSRVQESTQENGGPKRSCTSLGM